MADGWLRVSDNDAAVGNKTEFLSILDELQGTRPGGEQQVQSSLQTAAQRAAVDVAGRRGSVVAMIPSTGCGRRCGASPSTTNAVQKRQRVKRLNTEDSAPLFNHATRPGRRLAR